MHNYRRSWTRRSWRPIKMETESCPLRSSRTWSRIPCVNHQNCLLVLNADATCDTGYCKTNDLGGSLLIWLFAIFSRIFAPLVISRPALCRGYPSYIPSCVHRTPSASPLDALHRLIGACYLATVLSLRLVSLAAIPVHSDVIHTAHSPE